jgi:DNA adenine methylase
MSSVLQFNLPGFDPAIKATRPFVKWAGGKTRLLRALLRQVPPRFGCYYEPFLGGGALFFRLQPERAVLSDINTDLMQLYRVVRDAPQTLIAALAEHTYEKEHYYAVRALDPIHLSPVERAARMLFLNRTCFNGLYRVNRKGQFNVPMGRYKNPTICDPQVIMAASGALQQRDLRQESFERVVAQAEAGDFVYFDPPYHPVSATSNFTQYTKGGFGESDQRKLSALFDALTEKGVFCMLTNSDCELVRELYASHLMTRVEVARSISRSAKGRGRVGELIIRNAV